MSEIPVTLKYSKSHEWVRQEEDGNLTVGITAHAQGLLGDLVYVEPPAAGTIIHAGVECMVIESVKAASDVYGPVEGEIVEANSLLIDQPELINQDPYGDGWLFKVHPHDATDLDRLLDAESYAKMITAET
ncbi:glycine cleavage system protein H [Candidatus Nitrosoglobus terrae]|uniref:Glycine cleavage system H protein n=1 Tax=Candidatus Nitrosoglobus terrae TaxID=1630141 RepID=A0A1Q2SNP4_9GAMM|nr:glycine cleavage system protein GcvH [Candidatus Nitrosoglobus terrae]BAW80775.1 glycine cleavage system protein H [Candidatus Nitrosoglobus terrae]